MQYSYEEVIDRIQNTRRFGNMTGYEVSKRMLEQLQNPHQGILFAHIAGTNGKGSTTAFLCEILKQTGKKIGMFTSPHLVDFEERIRINGVCISKEAVTRLGNQLFETKFEVSPTMFDYCLCMAVLYFKEQHCDFMVIETGIGGRFDSTNALGTPLISIITKVGFDHMGILGNTLEEIAYEKAGIIKKGVPVVLQRQESCVRETICGYFRKINKLPHDTFSSDTTFFSQESKLLEEKRHHNLQIEQEENVEVPFFLEVTPEIEEMVAKFPRKLLGNFQIENAAAATLAAAYLLETTSFFYDLRNEDVKKQRSNQPKAFQWISDSSLAYIKQGIAQTIWNGRMELINENPYFLIDGAHNPNGVHALAESLKTLYPNEKFHFVMAVMADKQYEEMIEELLPLAYDFVTVTLEYDRALQAKKLAECIQKKGKKATYVEHLEDVMKPFLPMRDKKNDETAFDFIEHTLNEKTVAFGSLYFIGEIERRVKN